MSQVSFPNFADQSIYPPTADFQSGTLCTFQQTAAPVGWVKQVTHNDKALRLVTGAVGTGGANGFAGTVGGTAFAGVDGHVLVAAELANHAHTITGQVTSNQNQSLAHTHASGNGFGFWEAASPANNIVGGGSSFNLNDTSASTASTNPPSHNHTLTGVTDGFGSNTAHTHTVSLNCLYVDFIIAQKA
jgi:hypothetical protein